MIKQTFTQLKNAIMSEITSNANIVRALVIHSENFLTATPESKQQVLLDIPEKLIRKQVFPYKGVSFTTLKSEPYITMEFNNFEKRNNNFISGVVRLYIIMPNELEKTSEGSRYDFIADQLEELFAETGIGKFEFKTRGDIDIPKDGFLCHAVVLNIVDFHIKVN